MSAKNQQEFNDPTARSHGTTGERVMVFSCRCHR